MTAATRRTKRSVTWVRRRNERRPALDLPLLIAALDGLVSPGSAGLVVLIAGGDGKGADFTPLAAAVARAARAVVLIGRDAPLVERVLSGLVPLIPAGDMADAVAKAADMARPGDAVLLSPACASFDMFDNYEHRGRVFADAVRRLAV